MKLRVLAGSLYVQVVAAILLGTALGHWWPELGVSLKPLGDGFIRLIKMVIAPIVFCTVVAGIAGMHDVKRVGRVGGKALLYFEAASTAALLLGFAAARLLQPGAGFHVDPASLDAGQISGYVDRANHVRGLAEFLLGTIPSTFVGAFAQGELPPVLLVSVLFGLAVVRAGERAAGVAKAVEALSAVFFRIVRMITRLAPLGAGGAIAFTTGMYGVGALLPLAKLVGCFYLTSLVFVFGVLGVVAWRVGFSLWRFLGYIRAELLIVLATSSSEAALPQMMEKLERLGCSRGVVGIVMPTGYAFNLDGTNIYMTLSVLFLAQATDVQLSPMQQAILLGASMFTSKGAGAVVGAGFVALAASLAVVPTVPVASMVLILGVDRFMAECRSLTNTIGNGVATLAMAAWEGELDRKKLAAIERGGRLLAARRSS